MTRLEIARRYFDTLRSADPGTVSALFREDGVLDDYTGGHHRGWEGIETFVGQLEPGQVYISEPVHTLEDRERLTVFARIGPAASQDHEDARWVFHFDGEKIAHVGVTRVDTFPSMDGPANRLQTILKGDAMSENEDSNERRARGLAMYREVYGDNALLPEGGAADFFDLLIIDQQFSEVWSRRALPIPSRRLLTMGVLAATRRFDIIEIQFKRALETGELTAEQVREVVIHLISYVGTPSSGELHRASEAAIAAHNSAGD